MRNTRHASKQRHSRTRPRTRPLLHANTQGGKAGLADRQGGKAGHAKFQCPVCKTAAPSITSMQVRWHRLHTRAALAGGCAAHTHTHPCRRLPAGRALCLLRVQTHWENKHPKLPFDPAACQDLHAANGGVTTAGIAVRGSLKK